jgi:pimeloyl-ACP methyl ester carboxylesterase
MDCFAALATTKSVWRCPVTAGIALLLAGASGGFAAPLTCDDTIKTSFKPDDATSVILVKPFKHGDPIRLENSRAPYPAAPADLCLVKLIVGPGKPGTAGAPSTSAGIGIEVWLPAPERWNEIIRAHGSGGWAGGYQSDLRAIGFRGGADATIVAETAKGYVVSTSDHGHFSRLWSADGSFAMDENGGINTVLWKDFAERSLHELADKTKALANAYYGRPQRYAYWDGFSTGGRQGLKLAQKYPNDFDGILAGAPAINWSRFVTGELYPQVVMERDLGGPIAAYKLNLVGAAATGSCGGTALGFLLDPTQCRYDPAKDLNVLCSSETADGRAGAGPRGACVTLAEARAIDKIWHGETSDGAYADPAEDNGMSTSVDGARHLWWGLPRGTSLEILAGRAPFPIASTQVALELQNPAYAQFGPFLHNKTGEGADKWRELDYPGLADAFARGVELQPAFSNINTDDADLKGLRHSGHKVLVYHGWADDFIMAQGTINYFVRASTAMGGDDELKRYFRLFMIPGLAHDSSFSRAGSLDPATAQRTDPAKVPLPQDSTGRDELFMALRNWVENGVVPTRIDIASKNGGVTMPLCAYPTKARHDGSRDVKAAASYDCK